MSIIDVALKHPRSPSLRATLEAAAPAFMPLCSLQYTGVMGFVDRSGKLPLPKLSVITPIPTYNPLFSKSLEEVLLTHAQKILALNKPIHVFWSGGIDSTAALLALREAGATRDQLTVTYNANSILEYQTGADMIAQTFTIDYRGMQEITRIDQTGDHVCVTGELGDEMFFMINPSIFQEWCLPENVNKLTGNWLTALSDFLDLTGEQVQLLQVFVTGAPFQIETFLQFWFWWQYCTKWQTIYLRSSRGFTPEQFATYVTRNIPFYADDDVQRWAIKNAATGLAFTPVWANIKLPLKQLIFKWNGDQDYLTNKAPEGSYRHGLSAQDGSYICKLSDGTELTTTEQLAAVLAS